MVRAAQLAALLVALGLAAAAAIFLWGWYGSGPLEEDQVFIVPSGASLYSVATSLEDAGAISSADAFRLRAKVLGSDEPVKAGEFDLPAGASASTILAILQGGDVVRRMITVPEGMPSIMVHERLMAQSMLTGEVPVPAEGAVLPDTYDFARGEARSAVLARMTQAMDKELADAWAKRGARIAVATPRQALILASIVEKETALPGEHGMVAGLYSNRVRQGMLLQADPTIIYPITKGKPLGRRILQSEIAAVNDYNTYTMVGLPKGPITNPGRAAIRAVMNPDQTSALYMVADGKGGHHFADTLAQHNANVEKWFSIRRERGEM